MKNVKLAFCKISEAEWARPRASYRRSIKQYGQRIIEMTRRLNESPVSEEETHRSRIATITEKRNDEH